MDLISKEFGFNNEKEAIEYLKSIGKYEDVVKANSEVFKDVINRGFLFVIAANEYLKDTKDNGIK